MSTINCLIVEDESLAVEVLSDYIGQLPFLKLIGTASDAIFAMEILQREKVDLIFLDINLPRVRGLDFLRTLKAPPQVIVTTAYHEYAIQGYELNVVDYLLKPIEFSRFLTAVNKLRKAEPESTSTAPVKKASEVASGKSIFVNSEKKKVRIMFDEVLYVESLREYVRIHLVSGNTCVTKMSLTELEKSLTIEKFLRTHRSYLVAIDKIESYSAGSVSVAGKAIPVGRNYRSTVQSVLG